MSVNKVILLGYFGKDFDVRYFEGGVVVGQFFFVMIKCVQILLNGI